MDFNNYFFVRRGKRLRKQLEPLLDIWTQQPPFDKSAASKDALRRFYDEAIKLLPKTKVYKFEPLAHWGGQQFMRWGFNAQTAMAKGQWDYACSTILDMVHSCYVQDRRVLYTIIKLLEEYL